MTVPVSRASAEQRAGRAGREGPGRVYRCWSRADHDRLPAHAEPEVATADLTGFVLELALLGLTRTAAGLTLLDPPPTAALEVAEQVLAELGAVRPDGERHRRAAGRSPRPAPTPGWRGRCSTAPRW